MSAKNKSLSSWVVFGMGNFIHDIVDAIEANEEEVRQIVLNTPVHKELQYTLDINIIDIKKFVPQKGDKYIFGFLNADKESFLQLLAPHKLKFSNVVHPQAYLARGVRIGKGNFVGAGVVIGPNAKIGNYNYFNRGALIGHDVYIANYNHFGPGSVICGRCNIKNKCNFGAGSVVNDGVSICSGCILGSLAGVVKNISKSGTYIGLPAELLSN
jgi:sugar O-acyltransferase (sialic acid O-acetyltransferase NeuD family)